MANEYSHLKIIGTRENRDTQTGELRIYVDCEEVRPRSFSINISKQDSAFINNCRELKGRTCMFPTREGVFNDRTYVAVGDGIILPIDQLKPQLQNQASPVSVSK